MVFDEGAGGSGPLSGGGAAGQGSDVAASSNVATVGVGSSSTGSACAAEGDGCSDAVACCSGTCVAGVCRDACTEGGQRCAGDEECCSGRCSAGTCDVVACRPGDPPATLVEQAELARLVLDGAFVYFTGANTGTLSRVPKSGGAVEVLARGGYTAGVAVDEAAVYWTDAEAGLFRTDKAGGDTVALARAVGSDEGIALDATRVYWAVSPSGGPYQLAQIDKAGGRWTVRDTAASPIGQIVPTADRLLWLEKSGPVVRWQPLAGGPTATLAQGPTKPATSGDGLAVDDVFAYFGYATSLNLTAELVRVPLAGGSGEVITTDCSGWAHVLDEGFLYCSGYGGLLRLPSGGGEPTVIGGANDQANHLRSIAVDATCAYWVDATQGLLMRAPK